MSSNRTPIRISADRAANALAWLFEHSLLGADVSAAVLGLVTEHDSLWLVAASGDLPPVSTTEPLTLPLGTELPLCRAARLGATTYMTSAGAISQRSPWLAAFAPRAASAAAVPIRHEGRLHGSLGVTYASTTDDGGQERLRVMTEISDHLAALLHRPEAP